MEELNQLCKNKKIFSELVFAWGEDVVLFEFDKRMKLQQHVEELFSSIDNVFVYLQYILIVGSDDMDQFQETTAKVLHQVENSEFRLNLSLCRFCVPKLFYISKF